MAEKLTVTYRIAEARRAKGWSQEELGAMVGVSQQAIQRYESGDRDIKSSMLIKLSRALNVTVSYLLGLVGTCDALRMTSVPLYGSIAAGTPIDMDSADETYPLPDELRHKWPNSFLLRVEGESMNRILPNGCYALINPCLDIEYDSAPYAICVDNMAATIKRVRKTEGGIMLLPDSTDPSFQPLSFEAWPESQSTLSVMGRVVWHCIPFSWSY